MSKAEELADFFEKYALGGRDREAAAELRRLAQVEREYMALKASIGEPVFQFRKLHCADWYDGRPDYEDGGGLYEIRTLYAIKDKQS